MFVNVSRRYDSSLSQVFSSGLIATHSGRLQTYVKHGIRLNCRNAATGDSPVQGPGNGEQHNLNPEGATHLEATHQNCCALSGLSEIYEHLPRALPWAITLRPFGAEKGAFIKVLR